MKALLIGALCALVVPSFAQNSTEEQRILIAYFSRTGNTQSLAEAIQKNIGGTLFRIETVKPYPEKYRDTTDAAKEEQRQNARPELKDVIDNMAQYDVVFLGFPCWWGKPPMAVFTFLESYDFSGKTIVPFTTHGGSGFGSALADIAKSCPAAKLLEGLSVRSGAAYENNMTAWLQKTLKNMN